MFFGRASLYVHMKKHGPSAKDCEGGVKYICPLSGCSDKFSGKEPFLEHLKAHLANSQDAVTKKCLLSDADASAIEIHIVGLFGKDHVVARQNDSNAQSAMAMVDRQNEANRVAALAAMERQHRAAAETAMPFKTSRRRRRQTSLVTDGAFTANGANMDNRASFSAVSQSSRESSTPTPSEDISISPLDLRVRSRRSEGSLCSENGHDLLASAAEQVGGLRDINAPLNVHELDQRLASLTAAQDAALSTDKITETELSNVVIQQQPSARRHVTFSPSARGDDNEVDRSVGRDDSAGGVSGVDSGGGDGSGGVLEKSRNERPVDLFENWSELFGESTFLPFSGKSMSTPSSPNPLHSSSRPTTPLLFRSSTLSSSPLPPPCTPTFFSSVGDRSELFASPPRPRSADGGFAADAGFAGTHPYQHHDGANVAANTRIVAANDGLPSADDRVGSPVPSEVSTEAATLDDEPERLVERRFSVDHAHHEEAEAEMQEEEEEADHLAPLPSQQSIKKKSGVKKRKIPKSSGAAVDGFVAPPSTPCERTTTGLQGPHQLSDRVRKRRKLHQSMGLPWSSSISVISEGASSSGSASSPVFDTKSLPTSFPGVDAGTLGLLGASLLGGADDFWSSSSIAVKDPLTGDTLLQTPLLQDDPEPGSVDAPIFSPAGEATLQGTASVGSTPQSSQQVSTLVPEMRQSSLDMQRQSSLDLQQCSLDMQQSSLDMQQSSLDLQQSSLDMQRSRLELQQSSLEMPSSSMEIPTRSRIELAVVNHIDASERIEHFEEEDYSFFHRDNTSFQPRGTSAPATPFHVSSAFDGTGLRAPDGAGMRAIDNAVNAANAGLRALEGTSWTTKDFTASVFLNDGVMEGEARIEDPLLTSALSESDCVKLSEGERKENSTTATRQRSNSFSYLFNSFPDMR